MKEYEVTIKEVLMRKVKLEAEDAEQAITKAEKLYEDEKIILDYNDLYSTSFYFDKDQ